MLTNKPWTRQKLTQMLYKSGLRKPGVETPGRTSSTEIYFRRNTKSSVLNN